MVMMIRWATLTACVPSLLSSLANSAPSLVLQAVSPLGSPPIPTEAPDPTYLHLSHPPDAFGGVCVHGAPHLGKCPL